MSSVAGSAPRTRGRSRPVPGRAPAGLVLAAVAPLLGGCLGDGPVPPEVQPLEVVIGPGTCVLNVPEVGAGMHAVMVVHEQGDAADSAGTARLLDADGTVLFEGGSEAHLASEPVRLEEGLYRVECSVDDGPGAQVWLRVNPARPGFESFPPG